MRLLKSELGCSTGLKVRVKDVNLGSGLRDGGIELGFRGGVFFLPVLCAEAGFAGGVRGQQFCEDALVQAPRTSTGGIDSLDAKIMARGRHQACGFALQV
jgi:hypothetical protein